MAVQTSECFYFQFTEEPLHVRFPFRAWIGLTSKDVWLHFTSPRFLYLSRLLNWRRLPKILCCFNFSILTMGPHSTKLDSLSQSNDSTTDKAFNDSEDGAGSDTHLEGSPETQTLEGWNLKLLTLGCVLLVSLPQNQLADLGFDCH